jgi:hypothetical protein
MINEDREQRGRALITSARAMRDSGEAVVAAGRAEIADVRRRPGATVRGQRKGPPTHCSLLSYQLTGCACRMAG